MADIMKSTYIECASSLGYGDITRLKTATEERKRIITECADGYVQATTDHDETKRSQYISALMILFWGEISKMAEKCKAVDTYGYEDFTSKLFECINTACSYNAWKDGSTTAEACIRSVIASRGAAAILYESNLEKNKANINKYSLDAVVDDDENSKTTKLDLFGSTEDMNTTMADNSAKQIVQTYLDRNKPVEAIIMDMIAFNDCQKYNKKTYKAIDKDTGKEYKYVKATSEFWAYKLVQYLSELPEDYFEYFSNKYDVEDTILTSAINKIKSTPNTKLYKFLNLTLNDARATLKLN